MPHPTSEDSLDTAEQRALMVVYADEIVNPLPSLEITKVMAALAMTNHSLRSLFQPIVADRVLKHSTALMHFVLQGEPEKARDIYRIAPNLLFMPVTATDLGSSLNADFEPVYRIINSSPLRAMAGGSDVWMLDDVLKTIPHYKDLITREVQAQFCNGFECPQATFDYTRLVNAITSDKQLKRTRIPNQNTIAALIEFKLAFLPDQNTTNQTVGHHFNMNEYERAWQVYRTNEQDWCGNQCSLFCKRVLGLFQGLFSASDGQALVQNPNEVDAPDGEHSLIRKLTFRRPYEKFQSRSLFDRSGDYQLGHDFAFDRTETLSLPTGITAHSSSFTLFSKKIAYLKSTFADPDKNMKP